MELKVISACVFDPAHSIFKSVRNDRSTVEWIECKLDSCPLRDKGQCIRKPLIGITRCPYGRNGKEEGPTKRAKSYRKWIKDMEERFEGVPNLSYPPKKLALIGEYVYLPYSHMDMCKDVPFIEHSGLMHSGVPMIPVESWNVETVETLIDFRPMALMSGPDGSCEIKTYQREEIPRFIAHLKELDGDMYSQLIARRPELDKEINYVGRKAIIWTLKPPFVWKTRHENYPVDWNWDGAVLKTTSKHAYDKTWGQIRSIESVSVEIVPSPSTVIVVQSNDWVKEDTVFTD